MLACVTRSVLSLLLFFVGLAGTACWIRDGVPERMKVEWFQTVAQGVDVVFLGSSHVFKQFDPSRFDTLREVKAGDPQSINLGALGMSLAEEVYLVSRILRENPHQLRWVVVEALPLEVTLQNENDFGLRRLEWHDFSVTWMLLQAIFKSSMPWEQKLLLAQRHGEHWWRRSLNLARGADVVDAMDAAPMQRFDDLSDLGRERDGYVPLEMGTANQRSRKMHLKFLQAPGEVLAAARHLPQAGDGGKPGEFLLKAVGKVEAMAREHDVEIIWWIHPNLDRLKGWRQMAETGVIRHLVAYDDPVRFPEFYQPRWRFDRFHLNRKGAERMTEIFAQDFVRMEERQ